MQKEIALSCVSSFETGNLDIEPGLLQNVLAIASGNSLYALESLFCDPCRPHPFYQIRHVIGNVGKSGVGLLISSEHLESLELDPNKWQLINHATFDGKYENNFHSTSLHLSLTGYEHQINTGRHGGRDREHFFLETVTSAYEGGTKVADLDLLKVSQEVQLPALPDVNILRPPLLRFTPDECVHNESEKLDSSIFGHLTSLDNWFEVLDPPSNSAIIRARGNWMARLALAAVCIEKSLDLLVFSSEHICWACAKETLEIDQGDPDEKFLFLC